MTHTRAGTVIAGVDGTTAGHRGVRYAALEARRRDAALSIVHVTPAGSVSTGPSVPVDLLRDYGLELLEGALSEARTVDPDLEVDTRLVMGMTTVQGLAVASEQAGLLVLGAERRSFVGQVWTGDVVGGVAARATCPVVAVPPEWDPEVKHGRLVVGVKDSERASELIAAGLALADELGVELLVLHAWKAPSGYDDIIATRTYAEEYERDQTALLESLVDSHRTERPDVAVRIDVVHEQPAHALIRTSTSADRLIVSRPRHGRTVHHLGGVARAVLREARCPVEVYPRGVAAPQQSGRVLETQS